MCEIPSNALLAEEFSEIFDGFSIGSNDLTQLTLGIDRNSTVLSPIFSEADPAVLKLITMAIAGAHRKGKKIGICGQRPSDDHDFVKFLIKNKIDSISLNPDAVFSIIEIVKEMEAKLKTIPDIA
jgi:pyruvate,water dikinase